MKIKFCTSGPFVGCETKDTEEVDDDTTEEELNEMAKDNFWNKNYEYWWEKVGDDEDED